MLGTSEIWIILLIVIILFGSASIPKIARSLGQAKKEFKKGMEESENKQTKAKENNKSEK